MKKYKIKKNLLSMTIVLSMGITFLSPIKAHAAALPGAHHATVGDDVFLGGNYIEVGVSKYGSFGTAADAPTGFHPITAVRNNLGLCVDGDGFDVGNAPTTGDFFLPGSPFEGYTVAYKDSEDTATEALVAARTGDLGITNISTTDTSSGDTLSATTVGTTTDGKLEITQVVSFNVNDKYFNVHVTYKNISSETLYDARYLRTVDPDQDKDLNGTYETKNSVPKNPPEDSMAIVIAKGPVTGDAFFYATSDSRARAAVGGGSDPYGTDVYMEDGSALLQTESTDDVDISMTYDLKDIAPGASVSLDLINSLDPNAEEALGAIAAANKTVEDVNSLDNITVSNGTNKSDIGLPETVDVTLSDSTTTSAAVTWDNGSPTYDGDVAGTYTFTGTLTLPDGVTNPNNYTVSVNVIVQAANNVTTPSAVTIETTPAAVTIEGTTKVGDTLTAQLKDAAGNNYTTSAAVTYEWYRLDNSDSEFVNEIGTGRNYILTGSDLSKYIGVRVTCGDYSFEYVIGRILASSSGSSSSSSSSSHHHSSTTDAADTTTNTDAEKKDTQSNNKTGWTQDANGTWYFVKDGGNKTTGWKLIDNKWYFFNDNTGSMVTDWYKSEPGDWSYDKNDTVGQWFHLDAYGKLTTGWYKDTDGNWYYLCDGSNYGALGVMEKGWKYINGNWYYFNASGAMASNTEVDGYTLGNDGAWVE